MARLKIAFRGAETVVPLGGGETTVGRSNACTIHLPDPDLADVHFVIRRKSRGWQLRDKGSGLGTRVNGKPVFATTLQDGDVVAAGGLECVFLAGRTGAGAAAPQQGRAAKPRPPSAAPAPPRRTRAERAPEKKSSVALIAGVGIGVVAVAAVLVLLLRGQAAEEEAEALWEEARRLDRLSKEEPESAREHVEARAEALRTLREDYTATRWARVAEGALREAEDVVRALDALRALERSLDAGLTEAAAQDAYDRVARLGRVPHPAVERRADRVHDLVKQMLAASLERRFKVARAKADELAAAERFGAALEVLRQFGRDVPRLIDRVRGAEAELSKRIADRYRAALRAAGRGRDLDARVELLAAHRGAFRGTRHADDLEVRISVLRARRAAARTIVVPRKKRGDETDKEPESGTEQEPEPVPTGPYEDPPRVVELLAERRFGEAARILESISRHPDAKTRVEELTLMATVFADLAAAVADRPAEFTDVLLPEGGGRADAAGANARGLVVRTDGGERTVPWAAVPEEALPRLVRQAGFLDPPRLGAALLLDEEGLEHHARRAWLAFFRAEKERAKLTRILARRRGIEPPEKGFEVFRGELVTPADKERTLLLERIERLGRKARITSQETLRRRVWAELEEIGEPARDTLVAVLTERRAEVARELAEHRAFRPSRFAARFGAELTSRRKDALAFILDDDKYPYPNKTKEAQDEAERLVQLVRDLYEQPYARLLETSDKARELDVELRELDDRLAKHDPLSTPLHESTAAKIGEGLDVAWIPIDESDRKRHAYNRQVLEYNRKVETSADEEERDNVLAVNEYRHMMGLVMVKIDERLVRAARKHSIEMVQLNYFDHNSKTPHLRTPNQRARREGYPGGVAENIARGASTGRGAFWQWFRSSGHHRNMLRPGHREMGCGACKHHWWTQKFGRATGTSLTPPTVPTDPDPPGQSGNGMPAPE